MFGTWLSPSPIRLPGTWFPSRLIQYGLLLHLKLPDGTQLLDAGTVEFFIDQNGGVTLVAMQGPHPDHEGFPERPVLCALLNH